jgi:hypothetical protein
MGQAIAVCANADLTADSALLGPDDLHHRGGERTDAEQLEQSRLQDSRRDDVSTRFRQPRSLLSTAGSHWRGERSRRLIRSGQSDSGSKEGGQSLNVR